MNAISVEQRPLPVSVTLCIKQEKDFVTVDAKGTWKEPESNLRDGIVSEYRLTDQSWQSERGVDFKTVLKSLPELANRMLNLED